MISMDIFLLNSFLVSCHLCCLLLTFANSLDPDQDQHFVGPDLDPNISPDLGPNCLIL